jgi:hypothetical protein
MKIKQILLLTTFCSCPSRVSYLLTTFGIV